MALAFDWRNCWYPIVFLVDLPADKIYGFDWYGETLVLFRDDKGRLACLPDRCPHRAARLSDGRLVGGKLECLYHGWQFNGVGDCLHIPQLPKDKPIPSSACIKPFPVAEAQGMAWFWPGDADLADESAIPLLPALARADVISIDYAIDLPYDQSYLIENVIDVAHIHIVHDGIRGGGKREYALPLEFAILENSPKGIKSQFRSLGLAGAEEMARLNSASVEFVAPNLIHYRSHYQNPARIAGLALYSLPQASGRCRLLYRKYSNFYAWRERIKPRWLEHCTQNTILKQDMALIIGQYKQIERSGKNLRDLWLPIKTCDTLVVQFRKWLDTYAHDTPFYRGYASFKPMPPVKGETQDMWRLHTRQCQACLTVYRWSQRIYKLSMALLVFSPLVFMLGGGAWWSVVPYAVALPMLWASDKTARHFKNA